MSERASQDKPRALQEAAYRYNCQPCKQRKTKCDRVKPCASCQLRGTQDKCYVEEGDLVGSRGASLDASAAPETRPPKRARVSQVTGASSASASASAAATASASASSQVNTEAIQQHIAMLRRTIDQLESTIDPSAKTVSKQPSTRSPSYTPSQEGEPPILTRNLRLTWPDVAHLFPPPRDVEKILTYFLEEMVYIMIPIQEKQFWRAWIKLVHSTPTTPSTSSSDDYDAGVGVSRCMVASLLMCLASTSFLIPQRCEDMLNLTRPLVEQRDAWITAAFALVKTGTILSSPSPARRAEWLHYMDTVTDYSLDRFGFDTLSVRIFSLLGRTDFGFYLNGECLRRAIGVNLYDDTRPLRPTAFAHDDPEISPHELENLRRRIGKILVVTERWFCLYSGLPPMLDDEAEALPVPEKGMWPEAEELPHMFSQYVSKLRLLPGQISALTAKRNKGDWATQRARDQEAVDKVMEFDRGMFQVYHPNQRRETLGGRSHAQVMAELPELLERGEHLRMPEKEVRRLFREFAGALIMTSSWYAVRCLATSNLMFLPWVPESGMRYYALNLARKAIELLPSIWMMVRDPYVPFSSSWISRHVFLACTVLSIPILGQETMAQPGSAAQDAASTTKDRNDFAPSHAQKSFKLPPTTSRLLDTPRMPASSSIDLDWFSGKLVEISSLFNKLAERGDQTALINSKLVYALLNSRSELRDKVLDKIGERRGGLETRGDEGGEDGMGKIESQRDLTTFVMAHDIGRPSPGSGSGASPPSINAGSPKGAVYRTKGRIPSMSRGVRRDLAGGGEGRVRSPSLHDLANAVDTHSSHASASRNGHPNSSNSMPPPTSSASQSIHPPSSSPSSSSTSHHQQHYSHLPPIYPPPSQPNNAQDETAWIYQTSHLNSPASFFPSDSSSSGSAGAVTGTAAAGGGGGDVLANVPLLLDTQDWLAILDGVQIPL